MDIQKIIQAWKDVDYRENLSADERGLLPEHPAALIDLTDTELHRIAGARTNCDASLGCCPFITTTCPPSITCGLECGSPYP